MSQFVCIHCQKPIDANAPRKGNLVTCVSCGGKVFMPQVQHVPSADERRKAAATANAALQQKAGQQRRSRPSAKRGAVSSNGAGVTMIILGVLLVGGCGLAAGGYFVYKSVKGHMDARKEMASADYNFRGTSGAPDESPAPQLDDVAASGDDAGKPTRDDMEKLQKSLQAIIEISTRLEEDYKEDLTSIGLNRLLMANRIAKDQDFKQSRKIIGDARMVIDKHRKIAEEEDQAFLKDLARLKLEGIPTEIMVSRIRGIMEASQPEIDKLRGIDAAIAGHYEQAINHLEATRGTWKLEGESVVFNKNQDAERYKGFFDEVDKCVQRQADLERRIIVESIPRWKAAFGL